MYLQQVCVILHTNADIHFKTLFMNFNKKSLCIVSNSTQFHECLCQFKIYNITQLAVLERVC